MRVLIAVAILGAVGSALANADAIKFSIGGVARTIEVKNPTMPDFTALGPIATSNHGLTPKPVPLPEPSSILLILTMLAGAASIARLMKLTSV